jgi:hypothetical protein
MELVRRCLHERFYLFLMSEDDAEELDDTVLDTFPYNNSKVLYTKSQWVFSYECFQEVIKINVKENFKFLDSAHRKSLWKIDVFNTVYGREYLEVFDVSHTDQLLNAFIEKHNIKFNAENGELLTLRNIMILTIGYVIARVVDITENMKFPAFTVFVSTCISIYSSSDVESNKIWSGVMNGLDDVNKATLEKYFGNNVDVRALVTQYTNKYQEEIAENYIEYSETHKKYVFNDAMIEILRTPELSWLVDDGYSDRMIPSCQNITPFRLRHFIQNRNHIYTKHLTINTSDVDVPAITIEI